MKFLALVKEKLFTFVYIVFITAIVLYVPLKVLSYGWSPNYAMLLSSTFTKSNVMPVDKEIIKESVKINKPIYYLNYSINKEENLVGIVILVFVFFNIIGICLTSKPVIWFAAMTFLMLTNGKFIIRILNCSPQILFSMLLMTVIPIFYKSIKEYPKISSFFLVIYVFLLRALFPPEIYFIDNINVDYKYFWNVPFSDLIPLLTENAWVFYVPFIILLISYKKKTSFLSQLDDSLLFSALFLQLFINLGFLDLALYRDTIVLIWVSEKIYEIIKLTSCFKKPRVKYALSLFVFTSFVLVATHDGLGRFSKHCIEHMPIDFSMNELKDWAPEPGGIIYNDDAEFAISQYYFNPDANYSYIYFNSFSLFKWEKANILNIKRMLNNKVMPLPDYYEDWVEQMKPADRLITSVKIKGLEKIEWLQCGRKRWIGRKKYI